MSQELIKITEIVIPEIFYNPTKINIELLDKLFSNKGGLIPGMAYMFTGASGAGKTTLCNYIMAGMATKDAPAIFISLESNKEQVKFQFDNKVNFEHVLIIDSINPKTLEGFRAMLDNIASHRPSVVVLDSLQFASQLIYGNPTSIRGQAALAQMLLDFSKSSMIPVISIGQCAKDGKYIGPSFVKHAFDGHLHAQYDIKSGIRMVAFEKNRFGSVGEYVAYRFEKDGSLSFMTLDGIKQHYIDMEFGWYKAQTMLETIYEEILKSELKTMIKQGVRMPVLKLEGTNKVEYHNPVYHTQSNSWMDFPQEPYFIYNTVFIDLEYSKKLFVDEKMDVLEKKFAEYLDRYPQFEKPSDMFILQFLILMTQAILENQEHDLKFWKTLDRIVLNHS